MNQEFIFVQTDPTFNLVLKCLKELGDQNRLQVTHYQLADLTNIESNDDNEGRRFMFGGQKKKLAKPLVKRHLQLYVCAC